MASELEQKNSDDAISEFEPRDQIFSVPLVQSSASPKHFFNEYIANRIPAHFEKSLIDPEWKGPWSERKLRQMCGDSVVKVEKRESSSDRYGKGNEVVMTFGEFLDAMRAGDDTLYLTTQELSYTEEGMPRLVSPPVSGMVNQFPWVPKLMGNLIPQNINVWIGSSVTESTSGLHHDHHDNLYILLQGEKRILLYMPSEARNMYTIGNIVKVHKNGRINYEGQMTTADGSALSSEAAQKASDAILKAAMEIDKRHLEGDGDTSGAEEALEDALEAALDAEMEDEYDDEYDDGDDSEEDEEASWQEEKGIMVKKRRREGEEVFVSADILTNILKRSSGHSSSSSSSIRTAVGDKTVSSMHTDPLNFSRVESSMPFEVIQKEFPLFIGARERSVEVRLLAGQMLYIPAGWFHEVFSVKGRESIGTSSAAADSEEESISLGKDVHFAFNYWFHPPDSKDFEKPYTSDFWVKDWQARVGERG